jgi:hypothetical protein
MKWFELGSGPAEAELPHKRTRKGKLHLSSA